MQKSSSNLSPWNKLLSILLLVLATAAAMPQAKEAPTTSTDPVLEKRVTALTEQLRCLVCQNQTIADSHADLAIDLKNQVREKLAQGMSEQAIIDYMVQRYGDFVLYKPPVKATTLLLWFGPFLLLIGGVVLLGVKLTRRGKPAEILSEAEAKRAAALLDMAGDDQL